MEFLQPVIKVADCPSQIVHIFCRKQKQKQKQKTRQSSFIPHKLTIHLSMFSPIFAATRALCPSLTAISLLFAFLPHFLAFEVQVPASGVASCFLREIHSSSHVSVHYTSPDAVHVNIKTPSGEILHSERSTKQGEYTFDAKEDGSYQICVSTDRIRRLPTTFRFSFWNPSMLSSDVAQSRQVDGARNLCAQIAVLSRNALHATHLYSHTAIATDNILKSSIALTGRLAAIKCVAVLVVALGQITHVRRILAVARSKLQRLV